MTERSHKRRKLNRTRRVVLSTRDGAIGLEGGFAPVPDEGQVVIRTLHSVVSPGTERSKLEVASKTLVGKARSRPDLLREVIGKLQTEGLSSTRRAVARRLDDRLPLGYSSAGAVLGVGSQVEGIRPGDIVAAGGGGYALHADVVVVPQHLVAKVPDGVPTDAAAFATLGAVGLHAFRLGRGSVGETTLIIGLGIVGLLTGLVAKAAGCRVIGVDGRPEALERARRAGFDEVRLVDEIQSGNKTFASKNAADAVLVCAGGRDGSPLRLAATVARDRARIVVVGDVPLRVPRELYYQKELEVVVSRSYGPGRYDRSYEEEGHDYPISYVRWTEQRNIQAFLDLLPTRVNDVLGLVTHRFPIERAGEAYEVIRNLPGATVLLEYGEVERVRHSDIQKSPGARGTAPSPSSLKIGIIGTGSFAERILVPALQTAAGAEISAVASMQGRPPKWPGSAGPAVLMASPEDLIASDEVDAVLISTRHDSHARLTQLAVESAKPVFVEKPLALSRKELDAVIACWKRTEVHIQVGFNRRYAPLTTRTVYDLQALDAPRVITIRVNAGRLPEDHWTLDLTSGGGRILGEMCHFVDLAGWLSGGRVAEVFASATTDGKSPQGAEDVVATLRYDNGSVATVAYTASGGSRLGKERIEVFCGGRSFVIDDWRRYISAGTGRVRTQRVKPDKGHEAEIAQFIRKARGHPDVDEFAASIASTAATLAVVESISLGLPVVP